MISRTTLAESVASALRHAILDGAYLCGERLVELSIAQEMNVSQNTARDALRLLEQDGLVVKRARLGTYVRDYSPDEVIEIYALWAAVEDLALGWAAERITSDQIVDLNQLLHEFRDHARVDTRFQLHAVLAGAAGRTRTGELLNQLYNQVRLLENLRPPRSSTQKNEQLAVYTALVYAISARNADRAREVLYTHLIAEGETLAAFVEAGDTARA
ncbi:MAG: hypothetical protein CL610_27095 [Anaerolineaceae bacterium]|nr:hypothetical protein [Anaerolineaceae bacterium]